MAIQVIKQLCGPTFRWVHFCTHTACIPWWQAAHSVDVENLQAEEAVETSYSLVTCCMLEVVLTGCTLVMVLRVCMAKFSQEYVSNSRGEHYVGC